MLLTAKDLEKAIIFATDKHQGQVRKGDGKPYILHPMKVMITLMSIKKSNNIYLIAIASILHDVKEDCDVSLEEIANLFGHGVASLVDELSSDKSEIEKVGKQVYLLKKMLTMSSYALRIKLGDILDNLIDIDSMNDEFKEKRIKLTRYILDGLKSRKLTNTHNKIIKEIKKELLQYKDVYI